MPARITKLQRWLDLIAFLVGRRLPVSVEAIMEGVPAYAVKRGGADETNRASTLRMFERDKDELRELGIPIETISYHVNYGAEHVQGYCIRRRDFYLPYLKLATAVAGSNASPRPPYPLQEVELTKSEAATALGALREIAQVPSFPFTREAKSAFRKLAFDLDPNEFDDSSVLYVDRPGADEIRARMRPLSSALLARKCVTFRYHGIYRGEATVREVRPLGLFFQGGSWYLAGHDLGREDTRVFRVSRMEEIEVNPSRPGTPDYEIPDGFRLEDYLQRQAWELGDDNGIAARVLFGFPLSLWADRNHHGTLVQDDPDGSAVREFSVHQVDPFLRWLLSLGKEVQIISPDELASELRKLAAAVAALYQEAR